MAFWSAVAPAIASVAGSIIGGEIQDRGQSSANRTNRAIAREQMAFQERMSNTAHQREVEDLRKAGLNPILSASHGGASSPVGSSTSVQSETAGRSHSAREVTRGAAELAAVRAATNLSMESAKTEQSKRGLQLAETLHQIESAREAKARATIAEANSVSAVNRAAVESKYPRLFGFSDAVLHRIGALGNSAFSVLGSAGAAKYLLKGRQSGFPDVDLRSGPRVGDKEFFRRDRSGNLRRPR